MGFLARSIIATTEMISIKKGESVRVITDENIPSEISPISLLINTVAIINVSETKMLRANPQYARLTCFFVLYFTSDIISMTKDNSNSIIKAATII